MKNIFITLIFSFLSLISYSQEKDAEYYNTYVVDSLYINVSPEDRDYRLMVDNLNEAIRLDSTLINSYKNRGFAQFNRGYLKDALKDYRKVLTMDSTSVEHAAASHKARSRIFMGLNMYDLAIISIDKAIEIDTTDFSFYSIKGGVHKNSGNFDESVKSYEIAKSFFKEDPGTYAAFEEEILSIKKLKLVSNFKKNSTYYPYISLSEKDSLRYPIKFGIEFNLTSIKIGDIDDNFFKAGFSSFLYSKYPPKYIPTSIGKVNYSSKYSKDTISIANAEKNISLTTLNSDISPSYDSYKSILEPDGAYEYGWESSEHTFDHIWDLSDFPFDKQKLRIEIESKQDTSVYAFEKNQKYGLDNHFDKVSGLPTGMTVDKVNYYNKYVNTAIMDLISPGVVKNRVLPVAVFEIILSRSGSLLFIKLFLGTFLAFIMSLSAFTISKRNFPSRIDVSVGALFIAVGNKYFVESTTPMVQILTKADIINNLSLLLIIMNVVFIISQHRKDINIGKFEDSKYTLRFSATLLTLLVLITILS